MNIVSLNLKDADIATFERLYPVFTRIEAERNPDDPPFSIEQLMQRWQNEPAFVHLHVWALEPEPGADYVGWAFAVYLDMEENRHLMQCDIGVLPEFRRQGWGRQLMGQIARFTKQHERQRMLFITRSRVPAGAAFMQAFGARMVMENRSNELRLDNLQRDLLTGWLSIGHKLTDQFTLQFWDGAFTDAQIPDMLILNDLSNQAPRENLDIEDFKLTPEQLRQADASLLASGQQRWTAVIHQRSTGRPVGYTEVLLNSQRPSIVSQGLTGVFPEFRNHGIGRWLKAAMLDRLLREWPEARILRTFNAHSNAPMLKINTELGFTAEQSQHVWQLELAQTEHML